MRHPRRVGRRYHQFHSGLEHLPVQEWRELRHPRDRARRHAVLRDARQRRRHLRSRDRRTHARGSRHCGTGAPRLPRPVRSRRQEPGGRVRRQDSDPRLVERRAVPIRPPVPVRAEAPRAPRHHRSGRVLRQHGDLPRTDPRAARTGPERQRGRVHPLHALAEHRTRRPRGSLRRSPGPVRLRRARHPPPRTPRRTPGGRRTEHRRRGGHGRVPAVAGGVPRRASGTHYADAPGTGRNPRPRHPVRVRRPRSRPDHGRLCGSQWGGQHPSLRSPVGRGRPAPYLVG